MGAPTMKGPLERSGPLYVEYDLYPFHGFQAYAKACIFLLYFV